MKVIFALASVGFMMTLTIPTPASAQKDPACAEKCRRDARANAGRGAMNARSAGFQAGACIQACPPAKAKTK
jgi:hypothetical protein